VIWAAQNQEMPVPKEYNLRCKGPTNSELNIMPKKEAEYGDPKFK
jgi:hypothetical protein